MAEFPALPLWTDALAADTDHLSHTEYGLYQRMLNAAWRLPTCDLPNDPKWLMKRFRLSESEYDELCLPIINEFWSLNSKGRLDQKRLKKEREYVSERSKKQQARAKVRWDKEKGECRGNAAPHVSGNAPTPTPTPTPLKKDSVDSKEESTGAYAPDAQKFIHDLGKQLLGESARGLITRICKQEGGDMGRALSILLKAQTMASPKEWVAGYLKKGGNGNGNRIDEAIANIQRGLEGDGERAAFVEGIPGGEGGGSGNVFTLSDSGFCEVSAGDSSADHRFLDGQSEVLANKGGYRGDGKGDPDADV